jgi:predicted acyl esterase
MKRIIQPSLLHCSIAGCGRSLLFSVSLLVCVGTASLFAQTTTAVTIKVSDGVLLDATITTPGSTMPQSGFPGVVLVHGYGGDKSDLSVTLISGLLVERGYATLTYSVRGQGISGGYSTTMGPREMQDLREVIQYFRSVASVDSEKLGVAGASQGGIHAWMAATQNMPGVKVAASLVGPPTFALDLIPNNCVKKGLQTEITLGTVRFGPERDRMRSYFIKEQYDSVYAYSAPRDLSRLLDSVRIPIVQSLGWYDVLFPVNGGIRTLESLTSRRIPVRSFFGMNGHEQSINLFEYVHIIGMIMEWFNHWLKDSLLAQATLPVVVYADDRGDTLYHTSVGWPPQPAGTVRLYLSGNGLTTTLPAGTTEASFSLQYDTTYTTTKGWDDRYSGSGFRQGFKSSAARFLSIALRDTLDVTGVPAAHLRVRSNANRFQSHIRLFDVVQADTGFVWNVITRGTYGVRNYTPGAISEQSYDCQALSHLVPPGHRIGVEVTSLDMLDADQTYIIPYFQSSNSMVLMSRDNPSYVDLPLVGNAVFADVSREAAAAPSEFVLYQNYPNPFNPVTTIRFGVSSREYIRLEVYSILGQRVALLVDGPVEAGTHMVQFNGRGLASGVYMSRLSSAGAVTERKMVLVK